MGTTFVTIREEEYEVSYRNHGYEPETGGHVIDWDFTKFNNQKIPENLTEAEEQEIVNYLHRKSYDSYQEEYEHE